MSENERKTADGMVSKWLETNKSEASIWAAEMAAKRKRLRENKRRAQASKQSDNDRTNKEWWRAPTKQRV